MAAIVIVMETSTEAINLTCGCDWDPEYHRELNARRNKGHRGAACTNPVDPEGFAAPDFCTACIFGCAP